jgi:Protein of unknown function (DUF2934)
MSRVTTQPTAKPVANTNSVKVPHERIAMRAYEKWMKRGCPQGTALQDWVEAEAELVAEMSRGSSMPSARR